MIEFVRIDYENHKTTTAEISEHRDIILKYTQKGYKYLGYIPVKFGPSGKTLSIDLIFEKAN